MDVALAAVTLTAEELQQQAVSILVVMDVALADL